MGEGGNIGVCVGEAGVFLIDDQFTPLTPKIRLAIAAIAKQPIRFLVNTHWHGDYTGGNEALGKGGTLVVAHEKVRTRLSVDQFIADFNVRFPASPEVALPVITFEDAATFHLNGEEFRIFHLLPAHTDGDSIIFFPKANLVHMGDTVFNQMYPYIDKQSGGSINGMVETIGRVLKMTDEHMLYIPGHGPLGDRGQLVAFRDFLADARTLVGRHVDAGASLEETVAANPLQVHDAVWGQGFLSTDRFTGLPYKLLSP